MEPEQEIEAAATLAWDADGNPIDLPDTATAWRVKKWQPGARGGRGELVYGENGGPLTVPRDVEAWELRELVHNEPGRYRLDAIGEDRRLIEKVPYAVFMIGGSPRNVGGEDVTTRLFESFMKAQTEQLTAISSQAAQMMKACASLLEAADGAGLPSRKPPPVDALALRNAEGESSELAGVLTQAVEQVLPLVSHTVHTKVLGLTPDQSLALMGKPSAKPSNANTSSSSSPRMPARPLDFLGHLQAVEALLSAEEREVARLAIQKLSPDEMAKWKDDLMAMSAEAAAELVRAEVRKGKAA
jgi:hypothetical protein